MMKKNNLILSFVVIFVCYVWLSSGIFSDREFNSLNFFYKHKLSTHFYFYSPIGESDKPMSLLTSDQQQAENYYNEFVELNDGYHRSIHLLF